MADAEASRRAREAPVGDQRHLFAHALAVKRRRGRQHLAHAGAALRPFVADDDDRTFLDLTRLDRGEAILFALEHLSRAAELQAVHARHLADGPPRRELSLATHDAAGPLGRAALRDRVCQY